MAASPADPTPAAVEPSALCSCVQYDVAAAFLAKALRSINYGSIAPVFFLYCLAIGFDEVRTGTLLTGILVGDIVVSLYLSTNADRIGRRKVLVIGSALKVLAGVTFYLSQDFYVLMAAGVVGVISVSGGDVGPLLPIEKAVLGDAYERFKGSAYNKADLASLLGWYNAVGYASLAAGAILSGFAVQLLQQDPYNWTSLEAYRSVFLFYSIMGGALAALYCTMSPNVEARAFEYQQPQQGVAKSASEGCLPNVSFGLRRKETSHIVTRLSLMFAMDAFAGGFVLQTWIAYWFNTSWSLAPELVGVLLMCANVVAGLSSVATAFFVNRFGPMLTMIASHFPSNILLLLVPFMPDARSACAMLVARFAISQMDVPARDTYVNSVVASDEKSAANGITGIARSVGAAFAPLVVGYLASMPKDSPWFSSPWVIAGVLKCTYDVMLYGMYLCDRTMKDGEKNNDAMNRDEKGGNANKEGESHEGGSSGGGDDDAADKVEVPLLGVVASSAGSSSAVATSHGIK
jgi:MFS family permease